MGTLVALCAAGPAMGHHEQTLSSAVADLSLIKIGLVFLGLATVCFTVCKSDKNKV